MTLRLSAVVVLVAILIACEAAEVPTVNAANRPWPAEPNGFVPLSDQPWDGIGQTEVEQGRIARLAARVGGLLTPAPAPDPWRYKRRSSSKDDDIVQEQAAPWSPPNVLRIVFTPDMKRDHEPSVHFIGLPRPTEVFAGWWMKVSTNWVCAPGCGKIAMLFPDDDNGAGVTYTNLADGGSGTNYVDVATTWPATGYKFWEPNVTKTRIPVGSWFQVEWHVKWESSRGANDGIIRWWVNGVLNGDYRNVPFPNIGGFVEHQYAPTLMYVPAVEQYMFIDHTYLSVPAHQAKQP